MASRSIDDILLQFLKDNDIYTPDERKVIEVLKNLGIKDEKSLSYLADLRENDISNEKTGLPTLLARRIVKYGRKLMEDTRSESVSTGFVPSDSTLEPASVSNDPASLSNDPVEVKPQRNIIVRYMLCQGLYASSVNEEWIRDLDPQEEKLSDLQQLIIRQSNVPAEMELELFSHEGYPLNANKHTTIFNLSKWKIEHMDLLYVFVRPQLQPVSKNDSTLKKQDHRSGGYELQIVSQPFGRFYIHADLGPRTSGKEIIQKVSGYTDLPSSLIKLYTRGKDAESVEYLQSTDVMNSGDKLTMVTLRSYDIYDGQGYKSFGKCTYNPQCPQTDTGYAKFYSILYYLSRKCPEVDKKAIVAYIQREYHLPPLTYSLKLLLEEKVLKPFACWVALVEGLYQVFKATLDIYCDVPEDRVFEFSDYMWGTIIAQSKKAHLDTERIEWEKRSLLCPISQRRMVEPVELPRCDEIFDKLSVEEKIRDNEAIPHCTVVGLEDMKACELFERLLMYTAFEGTMDTFTWSQHANYSVPENYSVPLLTPPDCTWQEIAEAKSELNTVSLAALERNESCLTFLGNGHMAVFNEFSKDTELSRKCILYNPLYNPKENYDGTELKLTREEVSALHSTEDIVKLEDFLHPKVRAAAPTAAATTPQVSRPHFVRVTEKPPDEAIMIVLDVSGSMERDIYSEYSRIRAAVEYFHAFINRTNGYSLHHSIGVTTFGSSVRTLVALTTANSTVLQSKLEEEIKRTEQSTRLYDAIMDAAHQVIKFTSNFPNCRRRIVCLTDGSDNGSKTNPPQAVTFLKENKITVDTILLTYPGENIIQKAISFATGGLCFRPESHMCAIQLFELETLLSMQHRKAGIPKPWHGNLEPFKRLPYNSTNPYGAKDVGSNFEEDLQGKSFTTPNRVIQQHMLIGPGVSATTSTGAKRLLREIIHYKRDPHPDVEIYPSEESNFVWKMLMKAPQHTPYEGGIFLLCAKFPPEYPMKPPEIRFLTPIYHCNINSTGRICHSILDRHYVPSLSMKNIIDYICGLLMAPEPLDPLDSVLAEEYRVNRPLYESKAREKTKQFAQRPWEDMRKLCIGDREDADAPDELVCPLTSKLFQDPVMTMFGHTYERKALLDHLAKNNNQDPIAKKEVDSNALFPNKTVLDLVRKYQANMCKKFT